MMVAFSKLNRKVKIHLSNDMPMKIQYGMDTFMDKDDDDEDDDNDKNYIRFFLAPIRSPRAHIESCHGTWHLIKMGFTTKKCFCWVLDSEAGVGKIM